MDLVASYDSEDSDIEEITVDSSPIKSKKVDVIDLDLESDFENETPVKNRVSKKSRVKNSSFRSPKTVDYIDIGSDEDCVGSTLSNLPTCDTSSKVFSPADTSNEELNEKTNVINKEKDYLNLGSCDSNDDSQNATCKVSELISSAGILNDLPSGPVKLKEWSFDNSKSAENIPKQTENTSVIVKNNVNIKCSSNRSTPDFAWSYSSSNDDDLLLTCRDSKQLKRDSFDTDSCSYDVIKSGSENDSCMYREDERVIEATQKNVVCRIPRLVSQTVHAHSNVITALSWCAPQYSYMFLSTSIDCSVKIWDVFHKSPVQQIQLNSGLKAAKWSLDGGQIIAGGYGKKAIVLDAQTGKTIVEYDVYNYVTSLEIHPYMEDVFLCGTRNAILGFDVRVNTEFPVRSFFSRCEEVLDIAFLDENEFICSTNIVSHDSADRTIMAWDFSSGAVLSNQIYLEHYTCPSIKVHPTDSSFVAQSNGDYIVSFSTTRPYKMKNKKYVGHKVSGFGIECDISPDGKYLATGDSEGEVYFYNYSNTSFVFKSTVKSKVPTNRLKWHPAFSSTMVTSTWDGYLQIWK